MTNNKITQYIEHYIEKDKTKNAIMLSGDWGIGKSHPDFYSEKGVSSILVNTEKGQKLFNSIKSEGWVINATLEEAMVKQGNLVHPTKRPLERDTFYRNIDRDDFIDNLKVGLQLKDRVKSILPRNLVRFLKQIR